MLAGGLYERWVLSVPKPLRLQLARDPAWTSRVGALIVRAVGVWQRRVARARGVATPRTGAITFVGPASNARAKLRTLVPATDDTARAACPGSPQPSAPRAHRLPWAELLRRVFAQDVLACPYGGRRSVVSRRR
jgi:hypothetical protein